MGGGEGLGGGRAAGSERSEGIGLLLNAQWDAFDTVRNNLARPQPVPGVCQADLGSSCWAPGIRESPS